MEVAGLKLPKEMAKTCWKNSRPLVQNKRQNSGHGMVHSLNPPMGKTFQELSQATFLANTVARADFQNRIKAIRNDQTKVLAKV